MWSSVKRTSSRRQRTSTRPSSEPCPGSTSGSRSARPPVLAWSGWRATRRTSNRSRRRTPWRWGRAISSSYSFGMHIRSTCCGPSGTCPRSRRSSRRPRIPWTSWSRRPRGVGAFSASWTGSGRRASRARRTGKIGSRSSGRSDTSWADMCRMLGLVSRKPVPVDTLMAFRQLADTGRNFRDFGCPQPNPKSGHPDGWGIACVGAEGEFYVRGPGKATTDPKYEEAVRRLARVCSPPLLLVAHLRYASKKDTIQEQYSHPFRREVDGRVTFFAHNGEIEGFGLREGKIDTQFIYDRFLDW